MQRTLSELRALIRNEDREILRHLAARMALVEEVGRYKQRQQIAVMQPDQVTHVLERAAELATEFGLAPRFARELFGLIVAESVRNEESLLRAPEPQDPSQPTAVVLGCMGSAAAVVTGWLVDVGVHCTGVDLVEPPMPGFAADALSPSKRLLAAVRSADILVLGMPADVTIQALPGLVAALPAGAVVTDVASVKAEYARRLAEVGPRCGAVSLNPMYGAGLSPASPRALAVVLRPGPGPDLLLSLLSRARVSVLRLDSAAEHDLLCARWQALTHATLLSFGVALAELGLEQAGHPAEYGPPPFQSLLAALARMLSGGAATYREIQLANPGARDAREELATSTAGICGQSAESWDMAWQVAHRAFSGEDIGSWAGRFANLARTLLAKPPAQADTGAV